MATQTLSLLIAYQLYLPKQWAEDEQRRESVGVPEEIGFQTKQQIALSQLRHCQEQGISCGIVNADAAYGHDRSFREGVEALGLDYVLSVQPKLLVWPPGAKPVKAGKY